MTKDEIQELRMIKNEPCVSIIVPVHKTSKKEKEQETIVVDHAIKRAIEILSEKYDEKKVDYLFNKLNRFAGGVQNVNDSKGLGIFLSKNVTKVVSFPYTVHEKVFVGGEFETRDLVYTTKSLFDYYFLLLSGKSTRLFRGYGDVISEIVDENYPSQYIDFYEYEKILEHVPKEFSAPSDGRKPIIDERRIREYYKNIDYRLFLYLKKGTPLIIAGSKENLAIFEHITLYQKNIIRIIEANFDNHSSHELKHVIKAEIGKYIEKENEKLVNGFQEISGSQKVLWGISDTWKAAGDGKVMALLVEKDYICPAALSKDGRELYMNGNSNKENHIHLNDAVNNIISTVLDNGGDVIFLENGKLAKYDKIAVVLKYAG